MTYSKRGLDIKRVQNTFVVPVIADFADEALLTAKCTATNMFPPELHGLV